MSDGAERDIDPQILKLMNTTISELCGPENEFDRAHAKCEAWQRQQALARLRAQLEVISPPDLVEMVRDYLSDYAENGISNHEEDELIDAAWVRLFGERIFKPDPACEKAEASCEPTPAFVSDPFDDILLSPAQTARALGCSESTVKRMVADHRLPPKERRGARRTGWPLRVVRAAREAILKGRNGDKS